MAVLPLPDDRRTLDRQIDYLAGKLGDHDEELGSLRNEILEIIRDAEQKMLTEEERQWVRLAIKKQAQSIELRQAVITKTLSGLAWSALLGFGYIILDFLRTHGLKI